MFHSFGSFPVNRLQQPADVKTKQSMVHVGYYDLFLAHDRPYFVLQYTDRALLVAAGYILTAIQKVKKKYYRVCYCCLFGLVFELGFRFFCFRHSAVKLLSVLLH